MHPVISRFNRLPMTAKAVAAGAGFAALLSLALPAPGRRPRASSAAPPQPPIMRSLLPAETRPEAGSLTLSSLSVGPEPRVCAPGRQVAATFITDDGESCHVVATARLADAGSASFIRWSVRAPGGFQTPADGDWTGPRLDVRLRRPGGNSGGLGGPLSLTVQALVQGNAQEYTARETVVQDEVDQLRQEYVDLGRRTVPDRSEFVDAAAFSARYGRSYPWLHFEDLNWSVNPNTRLRYSYAIIRPELVQGLDQVRREYGGVVINSGYRNPVRQVEVHAPVHESLHQYGYAADLAVTPGEGRALPNEADWRRLAEVACAAQAKWVEPLASSAPNSPGCHVHLDYRPGPVSSAPVHLRGQVVEARTGRPVAGALVLLGAMPARSDANGFFGIRQVLSGGLHPVEVHADGFEVLNQPVRLVAWGSAVVHLALSPAVRRPFTVEVARTSWVDRRARMLAAMLRVSNTSGAAVGDVRLSLAPAQATLVSQEPADLGSLAAGAVRGVRVVLHLSRGENPARLAVSLAYRGASGIEERAHVDLAVAPLGGISSSAGTRIAKKPPVRALPLPPTVGESPRFPPPSATPPRRAAAGTSATPGPVAEPAKLPAASASAAAPATNPVPAGGAPEPAKAPPTASSVPGSAPSSGQDGGSGGPPPAKPSPPQAAPTAPGAEPKTTPAADAKGPGANPPSGSAKSPGPGS
jgi:hypothetical protein